jgi:integrase
MYAGRGPARKKSREHGTTPGEVSYEASTRKPCVKARSPSALVGSCVCEPHEKKPGVAALIKYFGDTPLSEIDQAAVDQAAAALVPNGKPVTRNAYVYTPVSAILHHAGIDITVRRPKGFRGRTITDWLVPEDAFGIIAAADRFDREVGTLLCYLLYTGSRIGAALSLLREDVRLKDRRAWARSQKGQPHMDVRLHPDLCARLAEHLATHNHHRVFRLHYGAHLNHQLSRAVLGYLGIRCPVRRPFSCECRG